MVSFDRAYLCHKISFLIVSLGGFSTRPPAVFEVCSLNEGVLDWEGPCIASVGRGGGQCLRRSRGGNVDQGAPLRPIRGAGTGAGVESEKSRIRTVAPARLEVGDGGGGGTRGQRAVAAPGLHLQSRVCQHVRLPGQSPQTGKRGRGASPWAGGGGGRAREGVRKRRADAAGASGPQKFGRLYQVMEEVSPRRSPPGRVHPRGAQRTGGGGGGGGAAADGTLSSARGPRMRIFRRKSVPLPPSRLVAPALAI